MDVGVLLEKLKKEIPVQFYQEQDRPDHFFLEVNPKIKVEIHNLKPGYFFQSILCPIPDGPKEDLFIYLMRANFLGQGTGESVIGIDETEKQFTLTYAISDELPYEQFKERLEDYVNYIDYWREEIHKHQTA